MTMGLLKQECTSYVQSHNNSDDIKRLMDEIYFKSRNHFSKVIAGDSSLLFTNSILRNVFSNYEKFGEISSGVIKFEQKNNYFIVRSELNFARYIFIYGVILVLGLLTTINFKADIIVFAVTAFILLFAFIILCSQFAVYKFNSMIRACIKDCNFEIE